DEVEIINRNVSLFVAEDTFHQNETVPGPVTLICMYLVLLPLPPAWAASSPSCVMSACPFQGGVPLVVQLTPGVSTAAANGITAVTERTAFELTTSPRGF